MPKLNIVELNNGNEVGKVFCSVELINATHGLFIQFFYFIIYFTHACIDFYELVYVFVIWLAHAFIS